MKNKKIKVATMTFHMAHNYGAMLQAYALEKAINKMGYRCEVLDYRFRYIDSWSGIQTYQDVIKQLGLVKGSYEYLMRILCRQIPKETTIRYRFNRFMRKHLNLSKKTYYHAKELTEVEYDAIILGSDQIWNPKLTNGVASEYVGEHFNRKNMKVFSYAASCGTDCFPDDVEEQMLSMVERLDHISVREESFALYLQKKCSKQVYCVLDPVFLLEEKDWRKIFSTSNGLVNCPYLLLYSFDTDDVVYDIARKISRLLNLKIVSIVYKKNSDVESDILQLDDCGPIEFVNLIAHASFVLTSSFHGEAFSIIFNKPFYCIPHPLYYQRNIDLLKMLGMENRIISNLNDISTIIKCDFTNANIIIQNKRREAFEYLNDAIKC